MEEARRHARVAPVLRRALGLGLRALPGAAPGVIYTTLLRPTPLRAAAHRILRRLVPAEIVLPEGRLCDPVAVLGGLKARGYTLTLIHEGGGADTPVEPAALPSRVRGRDPYVNLLARHR